MKMPMIDDNLDNPTASNQKYKKVNIRKENYGFIILLQFACFIFMQTGEDIMSSYL